VLQGSSLSRTLANLFCLDLIHITHKGRHATNILYSECSIRNQDQNYTLSYVDDVYSIIKSWFLTIHSKIRNHLDLMRIYFDANRLRINALKTQIMLWGEHKPLPPSKLKVNLVKLNTNNFGALREGSLKKNIKVWSLTIPRWPPPPPKLKCGLLSVKFFNEFFSHSTWY